MCVWRVVAGGAARERAPRIYRIRAEAADKYRKRKPQSNVRCRSRRISLLPPLLLAPSTRPRRRRAVGGLRPGSGSVVVLRVDAETNHSRRRD